MARSMVGSVNGSRSSKNDAEEIERREANSTMRLVGARLLRTGMRKI
jgi:hypothetical protein